MKTNTKAWIKTNKKGASNMKVLSTLLFASIMISLLSVSSLAALITDQAADVKLSGTTVNNADLTVLIYEAASGGTPIYNETFSNAITSGSWDVTLGETSSLTLEYGKTYYKDYEIDGTNINFLNNTGGTVDRKAFISTTGDVGSEDVSFTAGLTVSGNHIIIDNNKDLAGKDTSGTARSIAKILPSNDTRLNTFSTHNILFTVSGSEKVRMDSSGNMGIGTTSPAGKLHVSGSGSTNILSSRHSDGAGGAYYTIQRSRGTEASPTALQDGDAIGYFYWRGYNGSSYLGPATIAAVVNGTVGADIPAAITFSTDQEHMRISPDGKVGIGTTSPEKLFHINGDSSSVGIIIERSGAVNHSFGLDVTNNGAQDILAVRDRTNSTYPFVITDDGEVGIGTVSPQQQIHIEGSDINLTSSTQYAGELLVFSDDNYSQNKGGSIGFGGKYSAAGASYTFGSIKGAKESASEGDGSGYLAFYTRQPGSTAEHLRITSTGNVGIGTTSPGRKLHIENGDLGVSWDGVGLLTMSASNNGAWFQSNVGGHAIRFFLNDSGTIGEKMRITSAGKVGIGTTSPNSGLVVNSSAPAIRAVRYSSGDSGYSIQNWEAGTGEVMRITYGGNLGIGTDSPSAKLHVHNNAGSGYLHLTSSTSGITSNDGFEVSSNSDAGANLWNYENGYIRFATDNTERMRLDSSGNLGIGTTNPGTKLDVNGGITIGSTSVTYPGVMRWSGTAFEGYNGSVWVTLNGAYTNDNSALWTASGDDQYSNVADDVGIGITNPSYRLHISETVANWGLKVDNTHTTAYGLYVEAPNDDSNGILLQTVGNAVIGLVARASGKVGIGESSPNTLLHLKDASVDEAVQIAFENDAQEWRMGVHGGISDSFTIYDSTGGDTEFVIGTSGNVGIGTTSPSTTLHLESTDPRITYNDSDTATHWKVGPIGDIFYFSSNSGANDDMVINNGNVGIGTTTPAESLHVSGTVSDTFLIERTEANDVDMNLRNTESNWSVGIDRSLDNSFIIAEGDDPDRSPRITIRNGKVGINESDPETKLHVRESDSTTNIGDNNHKGTIAVHNLDTTHNNYAGIAFQEAWSHTVAKVAARLDHNTSTGDTAGDLVFATRNKASTLNERMVIKADGKIGIGTTSPQRDFHMAGSTNPSFLISDSDIGTSSTDGLMLQVNENNSLVWNFEPGYLGFGTDNSFRMIIDKDGKVGIGTTTPDSELTITDTDTDSLIILQDSVSGDGSSDGFMIGSSSGHAYIWDKEDKNMNFGTNNTQRMIISNDGNVGIGTTGPSAKLEVDGGNTSFKGNYVFLGDYCHLKERSNGLCGSNGEITLVDGSTYDLCAKCT